MSKVILYISHLSFSALFTYIIIFISLPTLKKIFPAEPTKRGMHKIIKPSSGGISFIFTYLILVIYQGFYLPLLPGVFFLILSAYCFMKSSPKYYNLIIEYGSGSSTYLELKSIERFWKKIQLV